MRIPILIITLLLFNAHSWGQDFDHYQPVEPSGPIPKDFTTASSDKFERAKENLNAEEDERSTREAKHDFLLESNFLIDQVLGSGRVLFNDPFSNYLSQILDTILVNEPELRKRVRVYAVRSSVVNSFTTDDGIILVNIGLLAQLENEAQLAYILCHELAHFTERHVINAYVQNEAIAKGEGLFKRSSFDEKMLTKSRYSKELEKEADQLGFERFKRTHFGTSNLLNVYEVMRYAHLPFDDIAFDKTFFDREFYRINDSYFLNKVRPAEANEQDDPSKDTHPSPRERQQLLRHYISQSDTLGRSDFIVSQTEFEKLQTAARFELTELYLKADRPVMSIYNSYLLLRTYPNSLYLKKRIAEAIYMLSKFKTGGNFGMVHPGYSQIEGESQQVYHLFYRLKPEELCVLGIGYIWNLTQEFPEDEDLRNMADDLLKDLMRNYHVPGMFAQSRPSEGWDTPDTTAIESKYDRLKQKSKENPKLTMITYALVDLFEKDEAFRKRFDELEHQEWGSNRDASSLGEIQKKNNEEFRQLKNHGFAVGAEKVVMVSPTYAKLDLRKKRQHKFLHSESAKAKLLEQIDRSSKLLNLDMRIIDRSGLDSSHVETFNDITFLNEWIDARFNQIDVAMVNMPESEIDRIISVYGTEYFAWTGVINYRENKPLMYFYLLYALIPPAIPFAVYYLARPNYDTYYYCIAFNLRTGEPVLINYNNFRRRDARDMINSSVYDSLWQMKRKPKQKG